MTARKRLKRLVRARASKTGESYSSALRHFRDLTPKERVMSQPQDRPLSRCSFCGKFQDQVNKLIAGPGVFICDECVLLCLDIIGPSAREERLSPIADGPVDKPEAATMDPIIEARARTFLTTALSRLDDGGGRDTPVVDSIDVTATATGIRVDIHTQRPGSLIGPRGSTADDLRIGLSEIVTGDVALNVLPTS